MKTRVIILLLFLSLFHITLVFAEKAKGQIFTTKNFYNQTNDIELNYQYYRNSYDNNTNDTSGFILATTYLRGIQKQIFCGAELELNLNSNYKYYYIGPSIVYYIEDLLKEKMSPYFSFIVGYGRQKYDAGYSVNIVILPELKLGFKVMLTDHVYFDNNIKYQRIKYSNNTYSNMSYVRSQVAVSGGLGVIF